MRRKQTAWGKEKPVKAAWRFGKPQRAFLFFLMSRKLLSPTMELFRVVSVFVRRAREKKMNARGWGRSTCKTSKPFVPHVLHRYQWAASHYTTYFASLNSINYLTRLRRAGCVRGRLWVARHTNPSDGGPTATCQRCFSFLLLFCFVSAAFNNELPAQRWFGPDKDDQHHEALFQPSVLQLVLTCKKQISHWRGGRAVRGIKEISVFGLGKKKKTWQHTLILYNCL